VMMLDGARNHQSATQLRRTALGDAAKLMLDFV
jgi:hypothetical protein